MLGTRDGHRVEFHVQFRVVRRGRAGPINRGLTRRPDGGRGASAVADAPSAPDGWAPPTAAEQEREAAESARRTSGSAEENANMLRRGGR